MLINVFNIACTRGNVPFLEREMNLSSARCGCPSIISAIDYICLVVQEGSGKLQSAVFQKCAIYLEHAFPVAAALICWRT